MQTFLVEASQSPPGMPYETIRRQDIESADLITNFEERISVYQSDYYHRLLALAKDIIFDRLYQRYDSEGIDQLIFDFLCETPHTSSKIEDIFSHLSSYAANRLPNLMELAEDIDCLWNYYYFIHFEKEIETQKVSIGDDLDHIYLAEDCRFFFPLLSQSNFFTLITSQGEITDRNQKLGCLCRKITPINPGFVPLSGSHVDFIASLQGGDSLKEAIEFLPGETTSDQMSRLICQLYPFLYLKRTNVD